MKILFALCLFNYLLLSTPAYSQGKHHSLNERTTNYNKQKSQLQRSTQEQTPNSKLSIKPNPAKKTSSTIYFYDNMESGVNGWTTERYSGTTDDLWHQTSTDANSPTKSWWCGVEGQSNYFTGKQIHNAIVSPTINLTSASGSVILTFAEKYFTEKGWDFCMVDASSDAGTNWTPLRGLYGISTSGNSNGWKLTQLNLSQFAGSQINIRFRFDTGDSLFNDFPGWLIDDVIIYDKVGTISGKVFFDINQNSINDTDEPGINNWFVKATGAVILQTPTNSTGAYSLILPQGDYLINDIAQPGWTNTYPWTPYPPITLQTPDTAVQNIDFGYYRQGCIISGVKFNDLNRNGIKDALEPGIPDFEIWLISETEYRTTVTNTAGRYSFYIFQPDIYTIGEELKDNWIQTYPESGTWTIEVLDLASNFENIDFGNYFLEGANSIYGQKFHDLNQNGIKDQNEPGVQNWGIFLNGLINDFTRTDESGYYSFINIPNGNYTIIEEEKNGWQQTYPASGQWLFELSRDTTIGNVDFGNYYSGSFNSIYGQKFNDANRNGVKDLSEIGIPGWKIHLSGNTSRHTFTDSSGNYKFLSLLDGNYSVREDYIDGWRQSYPINSSYQFNLSGDTTVNEADFGNYEVQPGSISGLKFNDQNGNGVRDSGEPGLSDFRINISGNNVNYYTVTNPDGFYSFPGLWRGSYTIREETRDGWIQTYPHHFSSHSVNLDYEENRTDVNFGNMQQVYQTVFRTFTPESLALAVNLKGLKKPEKIKPDKVEFSITFINFETKPTKSVTINFKIRILNQQLNTNIPATMEFISDILVTINFEAPIPPGDSIIVSGFGSKPKYQRVKWSWLFTDDTKSSTYKSANFLTNELRMPMPNALNVVEIVGAGLKVGLGGAHTVLHNNYKDVIKSLVEKNNRMHIGEPRSLYKFSDNRVISKQLRNLTPTKGQNRLFAQAVAFKVNLIASDRGIIPSGLGNLIFNDKVNTSNPLNNLSLKQIASKLDSFMTLVTLPRIDSLLLDSTLRKINKGFSGPIDTLSFGTVLRLKGVRPLSDVPFLQVDSTATLPGYNYDLSNYPEVPREFVLNQNYPNPFNPSTVIGFYLPSESYVTLKIFNTLGQLVATVINSELMEDGYNEVELSAHTLNLSSGIYYYQLTCNTLGEDDGSSTKTFSAIKKMVIIK